MVLAERGRLPRLGPGQGIEQPLGAVYSLFDAVETSGLTQRSEVRRMERTADGLVATRLGLEESTPLLYLERLRFAGDEPLALDKVWLPFSLAEPLIGVDLSHTALYEELAGRTDLRVDSGRERIRADRADPTEARLLDVAVGDPVLRMDRTGCRHDEPVEWRLTVARARPLHPPRHLRAGRRLPPRPQRRGRGVARVDTGISELPLWPPLPLIISTAGRFWAPPTCRMCP